MAPTFQYIPVADIALDDETHMMTYRPQMGALRHSVTRAGVLMPLHLRRLTERVPLQVVCGFKRLRICQEAGHTSVPALVYSAAELPAERALLLALHDNLGCRELNPVEKARVLWRLQHDFGYQRPTLIEEFCPLLGLPPRATTLEAYYALANLDDALQAATVEGVLPLETALWIGRHTSTDAQALVDLPLAPQHRPDEGVFFLLLFSGFRCLGFYGLGDVFRIPHHRGCRVRSWLVG